MPRAWFAIGIAPENAHSCTAETFQKIREAAPLKNVKALGSCGIDDFDDAVQVEVFKHQVELACEFDLPLIVNAGGDQARLLEMLVAYGFSDRKVLVRNFQGDEGDLQPWVDLGAYVSFDALSTTDPVRYCNLAKAVPFDRIVVESGAPDRGLEVLSGFDPRCDQVVFVADVLQGVVSSSQLAQNCHAFYAG